MTGFFTKQQTQSTTRPDGKKLTCYSCGLYRDVHSPKMPPFGNFARGIMNIGEAPGETEDLRGKPWQGEAGALLRKTYKELGVDLFEDCININAVNCRPMKADKNRTPTNYEVDCCRKIVLGAIELYKPKVIVLFGTLAIYSVIGARWKKDLRGIMKWHGWTIPDQNLQAWVCPVFHPSYILRSDKNRAIKTIWEQDLKRAFNLRAFPKHKEPTITYLKETELEVLKTIPNQTSVAFDYETTGLKPHRKEHKIVCASVAVNEGEVYVFMLPKKRGLKLPFINLLANPYIKKMAHNMKFEETWSYYKLYGQRVKNWGWCSLQAAHILDNRRGTAGLKFQTYVRFGIIDYSSEIEPHLQATDQKNANSVNKVLEFIEVPANAKKLLLYCALDSIYMYRLAVLQKKEMKLLDLPF